MAPQFVRFVFVGIINTSFSYFAYAAFLLIGLDYVIANSFAIVLGILFSFRNQSLYVFGNDNPRLLWRFALAWGFIWLASVLLIGCFIAFGLDAYLAGAFALPFTTLLSYFAQRWFVFYPSPKGGDRDFGD